MSSPTATVTDEILGQVNAQIIENAGLVSSDLLTGVFRTMFRVERATEFAEPQIFQLEDDPSTLMDKRMSAAHWRHLPFYVANDEILAKRFEQYNEFQFIFVADLTPSMLYRWRDVYLGTPGLSQNSEFIAPDDRFYESEYTSTKLYILKYLLYGFLTSAIRCGFRCEVILFTLNDTLRVTGAHGDLPFHVLQFIDERLLDSGIPDTWEAAAAGPTAYERLMLELVDRREESVIVFASDFMDLVHGRIAEDELDPYLAELKYRHRIAVMQINDPHEVNTVPNQDDLPTSTRWAFQRDVEAPTEGGIGQQRYYRPAAVNARFMQRCRRILGPGDQISGQVADMVASRGITMQKFVYGRQPSGENAIARKLEEIGNWLEEA